MRNLNPFRFSFVGNSAVLRVLTILIIALAPMAAYAAKGPCESVQNDSDEGIPPCLHGRYDGTREIKHAYSACAGTSEDDDCTPDAVKNKNIRVVYTYSTEQSPMQAVAENRDAAAISQALAECESWANGLSNVSVTVTVVGGVATIVGGVATWLFPGIGVFAGTATIISGVVTIAGAVGSYNANATLAQCQQEHAQRLAQYQQRINSCHYVTRKEVKGTPETADSCQ
jgi:hypothetical protein